MKMFRQHNNCNSYRYGFNGMEKDAEIKGEGNHLDYGARGRDPRLGGGWWSIDPLFKKYPFISPYAFALNNPILFKDYDGRDIVIKNNGEEFTFSANNTSYSGSNAFITETVKALNHLITYEAESNAKYKVVTTLANDKSVSVPVTKIPINEHPAGVSSAEWNPKQGTYVKDAKTGTIAPQSPVGTLGHELGHFFDGIYPGVLSEQLPVGATDAQVFEYDDRSKASPYDNFMEEGVITNWENPYYEYQGQATRGDHKTYGFFEVTGDFTSNTECTTCGVSVNPEQTEVVIE